MRSSLLSVSARLALLSLSWALVAPNDAHANQHAPIVSFGELLAPVEIFASRLQGSSEIGTVKVIELHEVPADRTLVITDIQVRAFGLGAFLLRDGEAVAEARHRETQGSNSPILAGHTASTAGIEFGPGSKLQLQMTSGYSAPSLSLRGYYRTIGPELVTIRAT
jgi:hypothetical protein